MEAQYHIDASSGPGHRLRHLFLPQSVGMGKGVQRSGSADHDGRNCCYLVHHQRAAQRCWQLDLFQTASHFHAHQGQPDSTTDTALRCVTSTAAVTPHDWSSAFRCDIRGTVFHHELAMDQQDLLHVRLSFRLLRADDHHHRMYDNPSCVLHALCRGLPVALASIYGRGNDWCVCLHHGDGVLDVASELRRIDGGGTLCRIFSLGGLFGVCSDR